MRFELPLEILTALAACEAEARQQRSQIGGELLATVPFEYRSAILSALLSLEATAAHVQERVTLAMRQVAQHAHDEGQKAADAGGGKDRLSDARTTLKQSLIH